jgi:hypothetical protein
MTMIAKNIKTGDDYFVLAKAINTTNSQDNQRMILYTKSKDPILLSTISNLLSEIDLFVREKSEFDVKFEEAK